MAWPFHAVLLWIKQPIIVLTPEAKDRTNRPPPYQAKEGKCQGNYVQRGDGRRFRERFTRAETHQMTYIMVDLAAVQLHVAAIDYDSSTLPKKGRDRSQKDHPTG